MKINPFLNKKLFGLMVNEYLSIFTGVALADAMESVCHPDSMLMQFLLFGAFLFLGFFIYTVVISLIKTYITKED